MNRPSERGPLSPRGPGGRNSRTRLSALLNRGSWSQCMRKIERRLSTNRNAELQFGKLTLANDHKPIRRSALQSAGSWSQSALREVWRLPMNRNVEFQFGKCLGPGCQLLQ
jgi:hypothetical protein